MILVGFSMGSVIAFESIERFRGIYDGAIPACAVGAGAPRAFDGTMAISAAYDAVFGWPAAWGMPGNVRDDLDFETDVLPVLISQLTAPGGAARFEFIRRVVGVPEGPEWPFSIWYFTTEGRAELERRAKGPVVQNLDHTYSLSAADRAALAALGATGPTVDGWLAELDDVRFSAPHRFRRYVEKYADYTGKLRRPVLTLHTRIDALVPPAHISRYQQTMAEAGRSAHLAEAWTSGIGHCNFATEQLLATVNAMDRWITDGIKPTSFPAGLAFIDFDPAGLEATLSPRSSRVPSATPRGHRHVSARSQSTAREATTAARPAKKWSALSTVSTVTPFQGRVSGTTSAGGANWSWAASSTRVGTSVAGSTRISPSGGAMATLATTRESSTVNPTAAPKE